MVFWEENLKDLTMVCNFWEIIFVCYLNEAHSFNYMIINLIRYSIDKISAFYEILRYLTKNDK
jgi:hypothetical protein